jgi:hypothetical protein
VNTPPRGRGGVFTAEQLAGAFAWGVRCICQLEGVPIPDREHVLAELEVRAPGWPGRWSDPRELVRWWPVEFMHLQLAFDFGEI